MRTLLPTTLVGSYPQPSWLVDRARLADGSHLAFFEAPDMPYEFKHWHDFDIHIALEVEREHIMEMFEKGKKAGIETQGVSDHDFVHSIYFRDPNGYVIALATKCDNHEEALDPTKNRARAILDEWQADKESSK